MKISPFSLLLCIALAGCDGDAPPPVEQAPAQVNPEAQRPVKPKLSPLEEAKLKADAGKHEEAVAALESLLASDASDPEVWRLLRQESLASGDPGALLDRLDARTAIGGEDVQHFRLRASLALAADRAEDAMDAARELKKTDAEEGAAFAVRAILAGAEAPDPEALDANDPGHALILAALAEKPAVSLKALEPIELKGWRARLIRADLRAAAGELELARAEWKEVYDSGELDAVLAVAGVLAENTEDAAAAAGYVEAAAKAAAEAAAGDLSGQFAALAATHYNRALTPEKGLTLARELDALRDSAEDTVGGAWTSLARAQAAYATGDLGEALEESRASGKTFQESGDAEAAAEAGWVQVLSAWRLGLDGEIDEARPRLGERAELADGLRQILLGRAGQGLDKLVGHPLDTPSGVELDLAAARAAVAIGASASEHTARAAERADRIGALDLQVEARLEQERYARSEGDAASAAAAIAALSALAAEAKGPLAAEIAARQILQGQSASMPAGAPYAAEWKAMAGRSTPASTEGAIGAWAKARGLAASGDFAAAAKTYLEAGRDVSRRGPWSPLSVLAGDAGPNIDVDMEILAASNQRDAVFAGLALHEWWHASASMDAAFAIGDDPSAGLPVDQRIALNESQQRLRRAELLWLLGGAEPTAARATLEEANAAALEPLKIEASAGPSDAGKASKAGKAGQGDEEAGPTTRSSNYTRALPSQLTSFDVLNEALNNFAVLSYRLGPDSGELIVFANGAGRIIPLANVAQLREDAIAFREALVNGPGRGGAAVPPALGDKLRAKLLDVAQAELSGVGKYIVLPDGPLWGFPLSALPEQRLGRRFLADIRTIGTTVTLGASVAERRGSLPLYSPDFLGVTPKLDREYESDIKLPLEVENAGRVFGAEFRVLETGAEISKANFLEKMTRARYLHLTDFSAGDRGGFVFPDGTLSLAELRSLDTTAQIAILNADVEPEVAIRRANALRASGVEDVIVSTWLVSEKVRGRIAFSFYDARNRDRTAARSIAEARQSLLDDDAAYLDPSWWGSYMLINRP